MSYWIVQFALRPTWEDEEVALPWGLWPRLKDAGNRRGTRGRSDISQPTSEAWVGLRPGQPQGARSQIWLLSVLEAVFGPDLALVTGKLLSPVLWQLWFWCPFWCHSLPAFHTGSTLPQTLKLPPPDGQSSGGSGVNINAHPEPPVCVEAGIRTVNGSILTYSSFKNIFTELFQSWTFEQWKSQRSAKWKCHFKVIKMRLEGNVPCRCSRAASPYTSAKLWKSSVKVRTSLELLVCPEACHHPLKCRASSHMPNACCWHLCILISWRLHDGDGRIKKPDCVFKNSDSDLCLSLETLCKQISVCSWRKMSDKNCGDETARWKCRNISARTAQGFFHGHDDAREGWNKTVK